MRCAGSKLRSHKLLGSRDDGGIIAKAREPLHERLLAEPCHLALGVAARRLNNGLRGGVQGDRTVEVRAQLAVPDEIERFRIERNALSNQTRHLFQPSPLEHGPGALPDAVIERRARRLEAYLDRVV